ncbi:CPBP family intramembrane glutamic endopeptidase [Streptomyces sp. DH41]|uniref:CPBP family intramembrane glutamic endopeptidase n=1 Tax=Streptomyces sp. DH41 TaxID=3040125 RepID=UPI002442EA62|nr:CPBP family intramembrane metalloprotease [Streptomyces sp. DH41]MDG9724626.1 CPBP family intramembrane metalloprotease [Streptomyces sp. DH41]
MLSNIAKPAARKGVAAFLVISFAGTWLWLLFARAVLGLSPLNPLLQLPGFCVPGIAAVVVRRWITKEGFADAGLGLRLKAAWRYYAVAWLGPPLIAACTLVLAAAVGLWEPDLTGPGGMPGTDELVSVLGLMVVALILTPLYAGEEFGWTSYLRPRIFDGRTVPSVIATGFIWAVWHFPLAFIGYVEFPNVVFGLVMWTLSFQLQEIMLMWLYQRSGSVWVASLAHAGNNMVLFLILGEMLNETEGLGAAAPMVLSLVPMAAICLWIVGSRRLTHERRIPEPLVTRQGGETG